MNNINNTALSVGTRKQLLAALGAALAYTLVSIYLNGYYLSVAFEDEGNPAASNGNGGGAYDVSSSSSAAAAGGGLLHPNFRPGDVAAAAAFAVQREEKMVNPPVRRRREEEKGRAFKSFLDDKSASFGACLMVMDDNHFLVEWLSYHYWALPLRHVTVLVDVNSTTSPQPIFDRWEGLIDVDVMWNWTYPDAYSEPPAKAIGTNHADPTNRQLIGRQLKFYEDCMRRYKLELGWNSWIVLSDPDEFWSVKREAMTYDEDDSGETEDDDNVDSYNVAQPGFVMKALKSQYSREVIRNESLPENQVGGLCWDNVHPECLGVPRLQMCANDKWGSSPAKIAGMVQSGDDDDEVETNWNASHFLTLRWLYYPDGPRALRMPKNMIHVGSLDADYLRNFDALRNGAHPHRILPGRCKQRCFRKTSMFQIYHYSGSTEQRLFRRDPRGEWSSRGGTAPNSCLTDDNPVRAEDIVPWLEMFINRFGQDEAKRLLEGVGRVHSWPAYNLDELKRKSRRR